MVQNANSVECLRLEAGRGYSEDVLFKKLFSLDVWKEAFPALQRAYFIGNISALVCVSPHLMKHVRGLEHLHMWYQHHRGKLPQRYSDWIGSGSCVDSTNRCSPVWRCAVLVGMMPILFLLLLKVRPVIEETKQQSQRQPHQKR